MPPKYSNTPHIPQNVDALQTLKILFDTTWRRHWMMITSRALLMTLVMICLELNFPPTISPLVHTLSHSLTHTHMHTHTLRYTHTHTHFLDFRKCDEEEVAVKFIFFCIKYFLAIISVAHTFLTSSPSLSLSVTHTHFFDSLYLTHAAWHSISLTHT